MTFPMDASMVIKRKKDHKTFWSALNYIEQKKRKKERETES